MPLRPPDIDGTAGHAYLLPRERQVAWAQAHPDHHGLAALQAQVEAWFVNGDSFHPFWQWWSVSLIRLAPFPGLPPAQKVYPEAEFELAIYSLDPARGEPDVNTGAGASFMTPPDLVFQYHGLSDKEGQAILRVCVEALVAGRISPDQDFRKMWGEILVRLVNDYRVGTFAGPKRRRLAVDPYTNQFNGQEVSE